MLTGGEAMQEVLPGLFQWRVVWPGVWSLESWWLRTEAGSVLVDPVEWSALAPIAEAGDVRAIVLTVGWHERSARLFAARTGAPVFLPAEDVCMVEDLDRWEPYGDGDELPCGLRAVGVPGLTRGEQALRGTGASSSWATPWAPPPSGRPAASPSAATPTAIPGPGRACPTCSTSTSRISCPGTATPSWAGPGRSSGR